MIVFATSRERKASIMRTTRFALAAVLTAAPLPAGSAVALHAQAAPAADTTTGTKEGNRAPDFTLRWADKGGIGPADGAFRLSDAAGKPVVLAFYPKDFTSGCTAQMKTFTERFAELFGPEVIVVGISADSLETHRRFADSLGLPFKLLSDPDQQVARLYESAGANGYNRRTVYVIDRKGKIAYRNMRFGAIDPKAYADLETAVQRARE
jgi:thioredoxin-dependent peroxiredoxin